MEKHFPCLYLGYKTHANKKEWRSANSEINVLTQIFHLIRVRNVEFEGWRIKKLGIEQHERLQVQKQVTGSGSNLHGFTTVIKRVKDGTYLNLQQIRCKPWRRNINLRTALSPTGKKQYVLSKSVINNEMCGHKR